MKKDTISLRSFGVWELFDLVFGQMIFGAYHGLTNVQVSQFLDFLDEELSPVEAKVLKLRYGLEEHRLSLEETAERLGISPEDVFIIEQNAITTLRKPRKSVPLKGLFWSFSSLNAVLPNPGVKTSAAMSSLLF